MKAVTLKMMVVDSNDLDGTSQELSSLHGGTRILQNSDLVLYNGETNIKILKDRYNLFKMGESE